MYKRQQIENIRADFPFLAKRDKKPLVFLDNAATTQKPKQVISSIQEFYTEFNAPVHRGVYSLSAEITSIYGAIRQKVANFINAELADNIVYCYNSTHAINMVAMGFLRPLLQQNDEVIISVMEHHSNLIPWQRVCAESGAKLRVCPIDGQGDLDLEQFKSLFNPRTKMLAISHVSNVLGTINPIKEICAIAHQQGISVLVDGAQAAPHLRINVQDLDCDFYCFSLHKMYGPTGVGILYGKTKFLEQMEPLLTGGSMIENVSFSDVSYAEVPKCFEAGTMPVASIFAITSCLDYINSIGMTFIQEYEGYLVAYLLESLAAMDNVELLGNPKERAAVISLNIKDIHAHDLGTVLDQQNIAVRVGHHCAQPLFASLGLSSSLRVSLSMYNTIEELDSFLKALLTAREIFV